MCIRDSIKDMLFAMNELAGLQDITRLPGNEEVSNDLVEAILDEAAKFASEVVDPLNACLLYTSRCV